ncbi:uncharacterized protein BT62DRAFT_952584 [Guyanagaster necrorhizus]|uniref:RNA polymerase II-associated protein 1 C-terminal domain-containing protein n=1 Tax=Guyanagaster necrorhizus TaxID=856835 RepID=A0A9P7VP75_9AGAR|nr:uncharacterized protein BT62DRAFT_952584 [Guyanagaster necrorhizus MCA 3950]KAG7444158.1 hypothetical protein BT62DRAFT_952584 [Guyanagaster necrorhizus MCA 3950]
MHEHTNGTSLVGSVFERKPSFALRRPPQLPSSGKTGFPAAQHRSKSAFARQRDEERKTGNTRLRGVPPVVPIPRVQPFTPKDLVTHGRQEESVADWRAEISRQNELQVQSMNAEERERERNEIYERFGADIGDILRRAREARERQAERDSEEMKRKQPEGESVTAGGNGELQESDLFTNSRRNLEKGFPEVPITSEKPVSRSVSPPLASFPPPSLSASATRPSTPNRALRKIRFAELSPTDVHVYESAPPSPRKKTMLALPPPPLAGTDEDIVSLGTYPTSGMTSAEDPEEGSPEYIRRKYFPSAPFFNPDLAWMKPSTSDDQLDESSPLDKLRFDLSGNPIPSSISLALPTHLGLHHHAEGSHAGYTLDDIFFLTRSSVAAQRAAMLGVLNGVVRWLRDCIRGRNSSTDDLVLNDLSAKSATLLKRILFAGLEVLPEQGSVGARGIAVVWQCLVGWEAQEIDDLQVDLNDVEAAFGEVELNTSVDVSTATTITPPPSISTLIDALPLPEMLSQLAPLLSSPPDFNSVESSPTPNQLQLLAIVHRISKHSSIAAEKIVQTSNLVASIVNVFLLSPSAPHPSAIHCLITLVSASRQNAKALCDPADAMLKFVASTIPSIDGTMQYPAELAHELLVSTIRLYTCLGRYGMYSHTATDAQELWMRLAVYVANTGGNLAQPWAELIGTWIICATDPHRTSPSHDILWSQVVAWGWAEDMLALKACDRLLGDKGSLRQVMDTQGAIWRCISAWLEGSRINSTRGGQAEREAALAVLQSGFESEAGLARQITLAAVEGLKADLQDLKSTEAQSPWLPTLLSAGRCASTLTAVIRLWLACIPSSNGPSESPPFHLPFSRISQLCALLVSHPVWSYLSKSERRGLAGAYTRVMCRPLASLLYYYLRLSRKLPGSSDDLWMAQAFAIILRFSPGDEDYALAIMDNLLGMITGGWAKQRQLKIPDIIWERGGMDAIRPILHHVIQSRDDVQIAPTSPTPRSILLSTSQRLLTSVLITTDWDPVGLPLKGDWALTPIDHVLRSGHELSVFQRKGAFPSSWDTSETEIVRASLLLAQLGREAVLRFACGLADVTLSVPEAVFGCMKVFMLEHEQDHNKGLDEVFRDPAVGYLMNELVSPYTVGMQPKVKSTRQDDLEAVAARFLGAGTPFYQYYTDFVALYDSISFAHPLFARLLLPPTSMNYAVDYRKHLWLDYGHLIKSIHVLLNEVISQDIREYLYPVEHSSEMIGAYVRALVTIGPSMDGFVRFIAVHHVACNIWSDLVVSPGEDASAKKLFGLLIAQGSKDILTDILTYKQVSDGPVLLAPHCFGCGDEVKGKRAEYILRWTDQAVLEKMLALF